MEWQYLAGMYSCEIGKNFAKPAKLNNHKNFPQ